ncbi:MAG: hypothetical protein HFJ55_02505 [Clostridia bacterium]|nr:hypothetical protein [Clostridia bacterium]
MRKLNQKFEDMFKNEYNGIIQYVKKNDKVFLGIRHNYINLYVDGGSFLKLTYHPKLNCCIGGVDNKYFVNGIKMPKGLEAINNKVIDNIQNWLDLFDELILAIQAYQRGDWGEEKSKKIVKREKIIQQKLVKEFNQNSDYFAYDIEYSMKGVNDYILDSNKNKIKMKNGTYRTKSLGRADIMLIGKPINNKIKIYCMEVKEGLGAFGGVLPNISKQSSAPSFGSGIAGHLKNNVAVISSARTGIAYKAKDNAVEYKIKETLIEEIKYALHFYNRFDLLKNTNFKNLTDKEIDGIKLCDKKDAVELVFFLGNYTDRTPGCFEKYLGINLAPDLCSAYSVKNLLDNKKKNEINLDYIKTEELFDFKVLKTAKNCFDSNFDLDIEHYDTIHKEEFKK